MHFKMFAVCCLAGAGFVTACRDNSALSEKSVPDEKFVYYSKSSPSIIKINKELQNCVVESFQKVPPRNITQSSPIINNSIRCNTGFDQTSCKGTSYGGQVRTYDANDGLRDDVRLACLANIDIFRSYLDLPTCPKDWMDGGFAGWFDGRLTAKQLSHLKVTQVFNVWFNSVPNKTDKFLKTCISSSSENNRTAGTTYSLSNFPEYFIQFENEEKDILVDRSSSFFNRQTQSKREFMGGKTFDDLTAKMQATIDFCAERLSKIAYENKIKSGISPKHISSDEICKDGLLLF
ncbi:hypothetical protein N9C22_06290 [Paracoccaceae bacterium]|nr:hypothetical protein [Paracoccaceae bacterium]